MLRVVLFMELQTHCKQKHRNVGDMAAAVTYCIIRENKHEWYTQIFSNKKIVNFLCAIYSLSIKGKHFLFLPLRA
jgi:hypothetical protein